MQQDLTKGTVMRISIKSDVDKVVMITGGTIRDHTETISNWGRQNDGIETIRGQDATG
ncbi:hypothetical protein Dsin_002041, partial [Dipteronia sinensis]